MAKDSLPEQRTEMPTERRMQEIRKDGALFHSADLEHAFVLLTGFLALNFCWSYLYQDLRYVLVRSFTMIGEQRVLNSNDLVDGFIRLVLLVVPDLAIVTVCVASVASLSVMLQTNWNRRDKWIKMRWDLLNPIKGLQRIVSVYGVMNLLKALVKMILVLPIGFWALREWAPSMIRLVHMSLGDVLNVTGQAMTAVFWKIMYVFFAISAVDIVWGRFQWLKKNKMTKEEVKDDRKAVEGDETMRRKIIAKGQQRLTNKLRSSVPKADVIVTNPTHYAVALKYDRERFAAPIVVAKGTDFMAMRIREIAKEHNIPILERKALARALFASTEVGSEIPRELFRAVAEVLAYVYRLRRPKAQQTQRQ
ncbi:MAG: flagellar biosynthesis protein FlhB [Pseudomonadota bacterium]|jgi:flagellar biosynthetic protein FlhB